MAKGKGFSGGMGGGMNMQAMIKQAQKIQSEMMKAQEELTSKEYSATSGGGAVKATVKGSNEVISLEIQPDVVNPDDIEMLQDLIMAAVNEALRVADEESAAQMKKVSGGAGIPGMSGMF